MSSTLTLQTPSGATVELSAHKSGPHTFTAKVVVNNCYVARLYATHTAVIDGPDLILNEAHIRLTPNGIQLAGIFLAENSRSAQ